MRASNSLPASSRTPLRALSSPILSGTILDVNEAFTRITGYTRAEAVGHSTNLLRSGRHGNEFYDNMWRDLIDTGHWSGEIWNRAKDGRIFAELLTITAVRRQVWQNRALCRALLRYHRQ